MRILHRRITPRGPLHGPRPWLCQTQYLTYIKSRLFAILMYSSKDSNASLAMASDAPAPRPRPPRPIDPVTGLLLDDRARYPILPGRPAVLLEHEVDYPLPPLFADASPAELAQLSRHTNHEVRSFDFLLRVWPASAAAAAHTFQPDESLAALLASALRGLVGDHFGSR